jgi:hypothetical protein
MCITQISIKTNILTRKRATTRVAPTFKPLILVYYKHYLHYFKHYDRNYHKVQKMNLRLFFHLLDILAK